MLLLAFLSLVLAPSAFGQAGKAGQTIVYNQAHNVTSLVGTWSSGSQNVVTGAGFAHPANLSFTYPPTTGMSCSFTADGFYEIARYRMNGNGSHPNCITGIMNWCHGTYVLNPNGSMTLTPLGDGYQQIQDPCAPISNFIENYNDTELMQQWNIYQDAVRGYTLRLYQFDGSLLPPMPLLSASPNMLPTQLLRNVSTPKTTNSATVLLANAGERRRAASGLIEVLSLVAGLGIASLLL